MKELTIYDLIEKFELSDKDKTELAKVLVLKAALNTGLDALSEVYDKLKDIHF